MLQWVLRISKLLQNLKGLQILKVLQKCYNLKSATMLRISKVLQNCYKSQRYYKLKHDIKVQSLFGVQTWWIWECDVNQSFWGHPNDVICRNFKSATKVLHISKVLQKCYKSATWFSRIWRKLTSAWSEVICQYLTLAGGPPDPIWTTGPGTGE